MADSSLSVSASALPHAVSSEHDEVQNLLLTLSRTVRAHQLYQGQSPVFDRFVEELRQKLARLWQRMPGLALGIEEFHIEWEEAVVYSSTERTDNLAFLFYKDGIRQLTLLPGFEGGELGVFLNVVAKAHRLRQEEDDLITLLWEQDLSFVQYRYVDVLADGTELPRSSGVEAPPVSAASVRSEAAAPVDGLVNTQDFDESLYFLDEAELRVLSEEMRGETERDLWTDVINALLDRAEDGDEVRQGRVLDILLEALPTLLGAGHLQHAANLLRELADLGSSTPLPMPVLRRVRDLFQELAKPTIVQELVRTVENNPEHVSGTALAALLRFFPPDALAALVHSGETATRPEVKRVLVEAIEKLASQHPDHIVQLLSTDDPVIAVGAARWAGRLGITRAASPIARLLGSADVQVRLAAVGALQALRTSVGAGSLQELLEDPERDVRIAAARALGTLRYTPARERLESEVQGKRLHDTDLTERIAFFEAYGVLAGAEGVPLLDRILNGKRWLGRRESPEVRACAALALGRVQHQEAQAVLTRAAADPDPVVRSAVTRALRGAGA